MNHRGNRETRRRGEERGGYVAFTGRVCVCGGVLEVVESKAPATRANRWRLRRQFQARCPGCRRAGLRKWTTVRALGSFWAVVAEENINLEIRKAGKDPQMAQINADEEG